MSKMRKKFTKAERLEIVKQSFEPEAIVSEPADRYGISPNTLTNWRRKFREQNDLQPKGQGVKIVSEEERKIARLEKQLREAQLERDILKKSIGIFSKNGTKFTNS